jgi:hypothetical protein
MHPQLISYISPLPVPCVRNDTLHLASTMHALLPREIRAMIYTFLWVGQTRHLEDFIVRHACDHLRKPVAAAVPHFARREYVGVATADEVLEHLYKACFEEPQFVHVGAAGAFSHCGCVPARYYAWPIR